MKNWAAGLIVLVVMFILAVLADAGNTVTKQPDFWLVPERTGRCYTLWQYGIYVEGWDGSGRKAYYPAFLVEGQQCQYEGYWGPTSGENAYAVFEAAVQP